MTNPLFALLLVLVQTPNPQARPPARRNPYAHERVTDSQRQRPFTAKDFEPITAKDFEPASPGGMSSSDWVVVGLSGLVLLLIFVAGKTKTATFQAAARGIWNPRRLLGLGSLAIALVSLYPPWQGGTVNVIRFADMGRCGPGPRLTMSGGSVERISTSCMSMLSGSW